jgi:ABC-type Mn2+/Zn2+ transport system ATPase subunit
MSFSSREILNLGHENVARERFDYLVQKLSLSTFLDQSITTLSGGQLQRIEIARSLMREVPLILLDEPFASQDLASTEAISQLLIAERAMGRTVVLVAHKSTTELQWCDQVIDLGSR